MAKRVINRVKSFFAPVLFQIKRRCARPDKYKKLSFWEDYLKTEGACLNDAARRVSRKAVTEFCTLRSWSFPKGCACLIQDDENASANAKKAIRKGALVLVTYKSFEDYPCIVCDDPLAVFAKACRYFRNIEKDLTVTSVCGSIGKTTTKNMIGEVYKMKFKTSYTESNFNAMYVVAYSVQHIPREMKMLVQEVNEDTPGETRHVSTMLNSDLYVITAIDKSHFSHFGDAGKIVEEVCSFTENMLPSGSVIVNVDDFDRFDLLNGRRVITVSPSGRDADYSAGNVVVSDEGLLFDVIDRQGNRVPVKLNGIFAVHNIISALYAFAAGAYQGIAYDSIVKGLGNFTPQGVRQNVLKTNDGVVVYADCYNAVGRSMKSAISTCDTMPVSGKRVAVLGDIAELGDITEDVHREVMDAVSNSKFDCLLTIGDEMKKASARLEQGGNVAVKNFDCLEDLAAEIKAIARKGDLFLFKASHASNLEKCILQVWPQFETEFKYYSRDFGEWKKMTVTC